MNIIINLMGSYGRILGALVCAGIIIGAFIIFRRSGLQFVNGKLQKVMPSKNENRVDKYAKAIYWALSVIVVCASLALILFWGSLVGERWTGTKPVDSGQGAATDGFSLVNISDSTIIEAIAGGCGLPYSRETNAAFKIEFRSSGEMVLVFGANYYYTDGYLEVSVNGIMCSEFKDVVIKGFQSGPGSPREILKNEIQAEVTRAVRSNIDEVVAAVCPCIGNDMMQYDEKFR